MYPERWEPYALFLKNNGVLQESITLAAEQLSGIVLALQPPTFSLSPGDDLDDSDVIQAISQITGYKVERISKVSFKDFSSKVKETPARAKHAEVKSQLMLGLGHRFGTCCKNPQRGVGAMFYSTTDPNQRRFVDIHDAAVEHLVLYRATTDQLHRTFGKKLGNEIERSIWTLLRYYTRFVLRNHEPGRNLAALGLDLCTQVYPLGMLDQEPRIWRVLVA